MGRYALSETTFRASAVAAEVEAEGGHATRKAEQQVKEGKGLNPLVDPKGYGLIRRSISWKEPRKVGGFELFRGVAMLLEYLLDTTGSMGRNVDLAFKSLPELCTLLEKVLGRYDRQIMSAIFGDVTDRIVLCRSQAEADIRAAEQLTYMVPEKDGGDEPEDPHYGLFGAAYLTSAEINRYGLKSYHFLVTDAPGRRALDERQLVRIFSDEVWEKVKENGSQINRTDLPTTQDVVRELKKRAHAFYLQIGDSRTAHNFWEPIYGSEHTVLLPTTEFLPHAQAAIIGLTEGTLDLQSVEKFLKGHNLSASDAKKIGQAVSGIPIGAQAALSGFDRIPLKGSIFATKEDLWPIDDEGGEMSSVDKPANTKPARPGIKWK